MRGWVEKVKRLSKNNKKLTGIDYSMVMTRGEGGWGDVEDGKGGINGDGRRLDLGWRTHNTIYR